MVDIKHSPQRFAQNHYEIRGNKLEELVAFCLPKVRKQSSEFYSKDIEMNLLKNGKTLIDVHAGMGNSYEVILINN